MGCGNNGGYGFGGFGGWWIIIIIILLFCWGGFGGCGSGYNDDYTHNC